MKKTKKTYVGEMINPLTTYSINIPHLPNGE